MNVSWHCVPRYLLVAQFTYTDAYDRSCTRHRIHEEIRTHTYEEPVIEYERRCTIKRIPRVQLVDLEEEIEVPVINEVPMVVRVQVPTGE